MFLSYRFQQEGNGPTDQHGSLGGQIWALKLQLHCYVVRSGDFDSLESRLEVPVDGNGAAAFPEAVSTLPSFPSYSKEYWILGNLGKRRLRIRAKCWWIFKLSLHQLKSLATTDKISHCKLYAMQCKMQNETPPPGIWVRAGVPNFRNFYSSTERLRQCQVTESVGYRRKYSLKIAKPLNGKGTKGAGHAEARESALHGGRGNTACCLLKEWKYNTANGSIWILQGHTSLVLINLWGLYSGVPFSVDSGKEKWCMWPCGPRKNKNNLCKNTFHGLQMVQLECPRIIRFILECTLPCG